VSVARDDFLGLLDEVYGEAMSPAEFDWFFDRNPAGPRLLAEVREDGRSLGVLAMSYARAQVAGEEQLVAFAVGAVTHPDARGRGIFGRLELDNEARAAEAGATMALGFTNPLAGPILVGKLGWHDLYRMRLWARPLRARRTGEGALAPRTGEYLDAFGEEHAAQWRAAGYRNALVRTAEYLTWRYLDAPRDYRVLGGDGGFAVVGHAVRKGFSAGVVCELVGPAHKLLRRCVRESKGCDIVLGVPGPGQSGAYLAAGFVPAPGSIRVIGKPLRDGVTVPADWDFTLGDTDIF
jgi:GNAT superfamily N-acetyltransferase